MALIQNLVSSLRRQGFKVSEVRSWRDGYLKR